MPTYGNIIVGDYVNCFGMIEKDQYASRHVNRWIIGGGIILGARLGRNWGMVFVVYVWHVVSLNNRIIVRVDILGTLEHGHKGNYLP